MSLRRVVVDCLENTDKRPSFERLMSLINISNNIGLITDMNAGILLKVINDQLISLKTQEEKVDIDLSDIFDEVKTEEVVIVPKQVEVVEAKEVEKKTPNITINNNTQNIKTINNISMDIGSRRKRILEIVKARGAVTINEFIDSIKGCSSKTIQRELTSLVLSGTLKKTGERRWSKYALK